MVHLSSTLLLVAIPAFWIQPLRTQAYLNPGTGSYILQLVIAGLLGGALAVRLFWGRIVAFFRSRRARGDQAAGESMDEH